MHISEPYNVIFVHNQKAGGASIREYLEKYADAEYLLPNHAYALDGVNRLGLEAWNSYYSFGFVRNPWSRLVSWYTMIKNKPEVNRRGIHTDNDLWKYVDEKSSNFEDFVKNCTDTITEKRGDFLYRKSFVKPQLEYFTDKEGKIVVNFIGKFEKMEEDFDKIKREAKLPDHPLPHLNVTGVKDYRDYYNEDTKNIVAKRFKKDIEYFGYEFG